MPRQATTVAGIRAPLRVWRSGASALLTGENTLPPLHERVAILKQLVRSSTEWRGRFKAFAATAALREAEQEMTRLSLKPAPAVPAVPQPKPVSAVSPFWSLVREMEIEREGKSTLPENPRYPEPSVSEVHQ